MYELDNYIRNINKYWVANIKTSENDLEKLSQLIADTLHMCKVAMVLLHPVCPKNIEQLAEVYGIDEERYSRFQKWFIIDTTYIRPIPVNQASFKEILRHPYINLEQTKVIDRIKRQKGRINSWNDLRLFEEFPPEMQKKMEPYITFK